jgi:hypothetical protein
MKIGFIISRNIKKMESVVSDYEKAKDEAIEKYGDRDEDGKLIFGEGNSIRIKDVKQFTELLEETLDSDIEIEFDKFSVDDLEKCELEGYDKPTVGELGALDVMIL